MDIKVEIGNLHVPTLDEQLQPLLDLPTPTTDEKPTKTPIQRAIRKTFKLSAHLANLLPTGSLLAFQILSPIFTNEGQCRTVTSQTLTLVLLGLCGIACFFISFTDRFRDERGKVWYGLATRHGLWVIDGSATVPPDQAKMFRLRPIDFFHAFISILVFGAVAFFDQNVVRSLYPAPSEEAEELLAMLPMAVGVFCSILFIAFPTTRHGIGFPLSRR